MAKTNRTYNELEANIAENFRQRRDELEFYRKLVEKNQHKEWEGGVFAKNLLVFLYAHWEGFIKDAGESFLQYTSFQKIKYKDLNYGLLAISKLDKVKDFLEGNVALKIKALQVLFDSLEQKAEIPYNYSIATYSKLNMETLVEICLILGVDENRYLLKSAIIDEKLVRNRNIIAHGELIAFSPKQALSIYQGIFPILQDFKNDVLRKASTIEATKFL